MGTPTYRMLKGYTIDPGFSTQLNTMSINESIYKIRWEDLEPGPIGEYIEVIDYDPANYCFYEPVDLDSKEILSQQGLTPSEGVPKFHQQFVYAIIMQTIENFEKALGRKIIWRSYQTRKNGKIEEEYVRKLRVYPHAMIDANAFYTSEKVALLFGYFQAGSKIQGSNFPGGAVFTCLSPDIVAHETTHAILDSIFPRYLENTNPDVPAFHEAFADIVALLQRFSNTKLLEHQIEQTRGRLDEYSVMGELATQFGQALETGRGALRSAIGEFDKKTGKWKKIEPNPSMYQKTFEAHDRGAILVATIFESFMRLYNYKVQDLLRIATQGSGILPQGSIHPDLIKRLAKEAADIASHLLWVCIRALDYSPPFDITFGTYLRALITADSDICPDNNGYRVALIDAFRAWGIFPDRVNTLSVYSLRWSPPGLTKNQDRAMSMMAEHIKEDVRKIGRLSDREEIARKYKIVQAKLQKLLVEPESEYPSGWRKHKLTKQDWNGFLNKIGVMTDPKPVRIKLDGEMEHFDFEKPKLEVHSIRPAFRTGEENSIIEQVIITLTQSHSIKSGKYKGTRLRGGCTMVLSILNDVLKVDYIILKRFNNETRLINQLEYQFGFKSSDTMPVSSYDGQQESFDVNFERLHLH